MAFNSSLYRMADRIVGGDLDERLAAFMADGLSFHRMTRELDKLGVEASANTVQSWCDHVPTAETGDAA